MCEEEKTGHPTCAASLAHRHGLEQDFPFPLDNTYKAGRRFLFVQAQMGLQALTSPSPLKSLVHLRNIRWWQRNVIIAYIDESDWSGQDLGLDTQPDPSVGEGLVTETEKGFLRVYASTCQNGMCVPKPNS